MLLNEQQVKVVKELLHSDSYLFDYIIDHVQRGRDLLASLTRATDILSIIRSCLSVLPEISKPSLYVKAFSNKIIGSHITRDILLATQKANLEDLKILLETLIPHIDQQTRSLVSELLSQVKDLVPENEKSSDSVRILQGREMSKMMTKSMAQKETASKGDQSSSDQDLTHAHVRLKVRNFLESFIAEKFIDVRKIFLFEVLIFDIKAPLREAFMPRPRFALERALSIPHDYLNCTCCFAGGENNETVTSQRICHLND